MTCLSDVIEVSLSSVAASHFAFQSFTETQRQMDEELISFEVFRRFSV